MEKRTKYPKKKKVFDKQESPELGIAG